MQCATAIRDKRLHWLVPKTEQVTQFTAAIAQALKGSVWEGSCKSWYKGGDGPNYTLWPWSTVRYRRELAKPKLDEYLTGRNQYDAAE